MLVLVKNESGYGGIMGKYLRNLLKPEPEKSTLRILVEGFPFLILTILALIGLVTVLTFIIDTATWLNSNERANENKAAFDFDKRFVIYKKNSGGFGDQLRLDLQTGCLYIDKDGSLSVLYKDEARADCSLSYLDEYQKRVDP